MELKHYLSILWRRAWLLMLAPLLAGTVSMLMSREMQPVYRASATLLVSQAGGTSLLDYSSLLTSERVAKTYAELLTKRPLLERVISDLQLDLTPNQLAGKLNVAQPSDTQLLELRVEDSNPQLAVAIANSAAAAFLEQTSQPQSGDLTGYEQMLSQQIAQLESEISELETQLEQEDSREVGDPGIDQANPTQRGIDETALREARLTYATLLESYLRLRTTGGRSIYVEIVEPAALPARKVQPRIFFNTFVAGFAGLALSLGLVFLLDYLDDTLSEPEAVEQVLRILAAIASVRTRISSNEQPLAAHRPMSPFAEAHRTLRTNIQFSHVDKTIKTLLITSAFAKEGKTTTVANLGVVMAQAGMQVLIVDADLRNGNLHRVFGVPNVGGLAHLLSMDELPDELYLVETGVPNLKLLPSGRISTTPSELLASERMNELMGKLGSRMDILLLDSPPILAVTDPAVLAPRVDGVLLVVGSGQTLKKEARKALLRLEGVGATVLGAVLTKSKDGSTAYYYGVGAGHISGRLRGKRRILTSIPPLTFLFSLIAKLKRVRNSTPFVDHGLSGTSPGEPRDRGM
jgi:capsular exopolysaccharide synthesis family protein